MLDKNADKNVCCASSSLNCTQVACCAREECRQGKLQPATGSQGDYQTTVVETISMDRQTATMVAGLRYGTVQMCKEEAKLTWGLPEPSMMNLAG